MYDAWNYFENNGTELHFGKNGEQDFIEAQVIFSNSPVPIEQLHTNNNTNNRNKLTYRHS
jgi:hypothetical protein